MKKLIFLFLVIACFAVDASAQGRDSRFSDGITVNALPGLGATQQGDSLHYMGRFFMRNRDLTPFDSLGFTLGYEDSLRFQIVARTGVVLNGTVRASDTATVFIGENVAKYYTQVTAAGISQIPWHNILTATGGEAQSAQFVDIWVRVWKVGTEAPTEFHPTNTTRKKMILFPKAYD